MTISGTRLPPAFWLTRVGFIVLLICLLCGCSKPTVGEFSGVYSSQDGKGNAAFLTLLTNGSYQRLFYREGAVVSSQTGVWTFDATQSLVVLDQFFAFVLEDRGTQTSLVQTSTPTIPMPTTIANIGGTNVPVPPPFEIFYREKQ